MREVMIGFIFTMTLIIAVSALHTERRVVNIEKHQVDQDVMLKAILRAK